MALVTAAQVRAAAVDGITGTGIDSDLTTCVTDATAMLASWCRYPVPSGQTEPTLESATYVLYLHGLEEDRRWLWLPFSDGRVTSITSIYDSPDRDYGAADLVASSDYTLLAEEGAVLLKSTSAQGEWSITPRRVIKATVVAGWSSSTCPESVERAICLLAGHLYRLRKEHGHTSVSAGGGSVGVRDEDIPASVAQIMRPWRLIEATP